MCIRDRPWTLYDEQWNVEEQKWEWTVQRVIAYDTDYDLASFTLSLIHISTITRRA